MDEEKNYKMLMIYYRVLLYMSDQEEKQSDISKKITDCVLNY